MAPTFKSSSPWVSMRLDRNFSSFRNSVIRYFLVLFLFGVLGYMLLLPIYLFFGAFRSLVSHHKQPLVSHPGDELVSLDFSYSREASHKDSAFKHFAGSQECGLSQSDIYLAPLSTSPKASPFCRNRATLLEALGGGDRHGYDEPYIGQGCTYRWFSTTEICMILERFNALAFLGDDVAQNIYAAFNTLLREDLALGGLQLWLMNEQEQKDCTCDNQFLNPICLKYVIKTNEDLKNNPGSNGKGSPYSCDRIPHAYVPFDSVPSSLKSQFLFQNLTYSKPNPWQPSPLIFSFSHGSSFNTTTTSLALDEWSTLATAAERNIPMLFIGPPAFGTNKTVITLPPGDNAAVWQFQQEMGRIAKEKHFDVLSFYNLTVQARSVDGVRFGEGVALVQAMMVVNWLSKIDTS